MKHHQREYDSTYCQYNVDSEWIMSGIIAHRRDQHPQDNGFEDHNPLGQSHSAKHPSGYWITLPVIVVWFQNLVGGVSIQQV